MNQRRDRVTKPPGSARILRAVFGILPNTVCVRQEYVVSVVTDVRGWETSRQHAGLSEQHARAPLFDRLCSRYLTEQASVWIGERDHSDRSGRHVAGQVSIDHPSSQTLNRNRHDAERGPLEAGAPLDLES